MHFKRLARAVCYPEQTVPVPSIAVVPSLDGCLDDNAASEFVSGALAASAVSRVETHLASCRECRALVAALAGDEADSNALTHRHERVSEDSQVAKRPVLSIGDRVGRYLVLSSLGAGGMGVVFAAYDPQLDRKVALKLLRANLGANAKEARTRLKREAQAIAQLNHPNVVGVYDVGTTSDGDVYIAMEFVEGDTLTTWLKRWPRTWREILEVFQQAARGLMAAHSVGLLHRDFKPDNVLVGGDGRVRVTDFGLARSVFLDDSARGAATTQNARGPQNTPAAGSPLQVDLTATGTVLGTPRYMPPEQLTGPSIDARADQFSFCVALYEALYGTHPLPGATSVSMLEHDEKALPPPEGTKVPSSIARAVMRGLEKERSKRFPTLAALMQDLTPPPKRSPLKFIALAAIGAVGVTVATAAVMTRPEPNVRVVENYEPTMKVLIDEINRKDQEIKTLRKALLERAKDRDEIEVLKKRLDEAQEESRQLLEQLVEIKQKARNPPSTANARPPLPRVNSKQITTAIQSVFGSVEFCLDDLDSRVQNTQGAPRSRDIDAVVRLFTTPDGRAFDVKASHIDYSPSVRLCIEDALKRVTYPKGPETVEVRVDIAWAAGQLNMTARVVDQRESGGGGTLLDL
jgi:serine/threonine protein kinase